jgi:hypothetical protein
VGDRVSYCFQIVGIKIDSLGLSSSTSYSFVDSAFGACGAPVVVPAVVVVPLSLTA